MVTWIIHSINIKDISKLTMTGSQIEKERPLVIKMVVRFNPI